ncbi:MAG TPA: tetratricopeptide repeat protein [Longimicrobiales bacterium]|nr:tetratricopeptide repeat protein [Longimicrobiales bacterium]
MTRSSVLWLAVASTLLSGCVGGVVPAEPATPHAPRAEALSLLGVPLFAPELAPETRARLEADLAAARADYDSDPDNADYIIWLGRRLAYLGRYRDAIDVFTTGIERHPGDARMYRHRGHRYITTRQLGRAISDLEYAAALVEGQPDEVEPDGAPNRYNIPVSTLHTNIWYHLALAHYLRHDFPAALPAWQQAVARSTNDDMLVASTDWLWMTLQRLGRTDDAAAVLEPIRPRMYILENDAYHRRLLLYKGLLTPDDVMPADTRDPVQIATYGYGIANWYLVNGQPETADALFRRILDGRNWAAFGFIAAEAELAAGTP